MGNKPHLASLKNLVLNLSKQCTHVFSGQYPRLVAIFSGLSETSLVAEIPYLILGTTTALVMVVSEGVTMAFRHVNDKVRPTFGQHLLNLAYLSLS